MRICSSKFEVYKLAYMLTTTKILTQVSLQIMPNLLEFQIYINDFIKLPFAYVSKEERKYLIHMPPKRTHSQISDYDYSIWLLVNKDKWMEQINIQKKAKQYFGISCGNNVIRAPGFQSGTKDVIIMVPYWWELQGIKDIWV